MTIWRRSDNDVEFDNIQQFFDLYGEKLTEQNHFVPLASDGAASASELAVARFRTAVQSAHQELESATQDLENAVGEIDKACKTTAKRRVERVLKSMLRVKCKVMRRLPNWVLVYMGRARRPQMRDAVCTVVHGFGLTLFTFPIVPPRFLQAEEPVRRSTGDVQRLAGACLVRYGHS